MLGRSRWRLPRDPIGENGGINLYAYVGNSPINYNDPDGRFANFAIGAVIGFGAEAISQTISGDFNLRRLTTSTLVGSLTGRIGGGIAKKVGGMGLKNIATRMGLNAGVGVFAGGLGAAANCDDISDGAILGFLGGSGGSVLGDIGGVALRSANTRTYPLHPATSGSPRPDISGQAKESLKNQHNSTLLSSTLVN